MHILKAIRVQSETTSCFTMMIGRRRIGKTQLLIESVKKQKYLYLFVTRTTEPLLCAHFQADAVSALGLQIFGDITQFRDLFEQLLRFSQTQHFTLIIDEFQDFERINPAIFSEMQNLWDQYKDSTKINLIVCGSIYSLMTRLFESKKEPLFGRLTSKILLHPFKVSVLKEILADYNPHWIPEDLLCFYMITGGVPKYCSLLMDAGAVNAAAMLDAVTRVDSLFLNEGKDLLVSEFGRDYTVYFSILQLIATGSTSQREIDSIIGKNTGTYLANLDKEYSLIAKSRPLFSKPESRNIRWKITDNYLRFYFRFIYPNQALIEMGKYELLRAIIGKGYEQYSGLILENYFRDKIADEMHITTIGGYWDKKGENEIDIIALNDGEKTATFFEVKRKARKIDLLSLAVKAEKIGQELPHYAVKLQGLSLADM